MVNQKARFGEVVLRINKRTYIQAKGTIDWLVSNAYELVIGVSDNGENKQGVWLRDREENEMMCLCLRGHNPERPLDIVKTCRRTTNDEEFPPYSHPTATICTDECWEKVSQIIDYAVNLLEENEKELAENTKICFLKFKEETDGGIASDWLKEKLGIG